MIIVNLKGGLGNQMFQYAAGRALAEKHGVALKLDLRSLEDRTPRPQVVFRNYDLDIFGITPNRPTNAELWRFGLGMSNINARNRTKRLLKRIPLQHRILVERTVFSFDRRLLTAGSDSYLDGYWQTEQYFSGISSLIRELFCLPAPRSDGAQALHMRICSELSVCVHVRRTDFLNASIHQTTDVSYFKRALEEMKRRIGSDFHVFIFSDDVQWCQENLALSARQEIVSDRFAGPKASHHLSLMSACKHFIIPNSTFGWWAAWLSNNVKKVVIAPRRWLADPRIDTQGILAPDWIGL